MIDHPLWLLVPWLVFAGAVGLKVWQVGMALRRQRLGPDPDTERFRQRLERSWERG